MVLLLALQHGLRRDESSALGSFGKLFLSVAGLMHKAPPPGSAEFGTCARHT